MSTRDEVKTAAHQLGVLLAEAHADFYDVVEAFSGGYAEAQDDLGRHVILAKISALNELQSVAGNTISDYVKDARTERLSWAQIGDVLDISKQAAQQRFGA